jgi:hypothetical protein
MEEEIESHQGQPQAAVICQSSITPGILLIIVYVHQNKNSQIQKYKMIIQYFKEIVILMIDSKIHMF